MKEPLPLISNSISETSPVIKLPLLNPKSSNCSEPLNIPVPPNICTELDTNPPGSCSDELTILSGKLFNCS